MIEFPAFLCLCIAALVLGFAFGNRLTNYADFIVYREHLAPGEFHRGHPLKYNRWARAAGELFPPDLTACKQKDLTPAPNPNSVFLGDWQ